MHIGYILWELSFIALIIFCVLGLFWLRTGHR
jgi:hypothetical protein